MNLSRDIFGEQPKLGVLIDPDFEQSDHFEKLLVLLEKGWADVVLVGGSSSHRDNFESVVTALTKRLPQKVLIFPGNTMQLSSNADALLLPSLISGRNPEYLIGKHVEAASIIYESGIPVFSMGYIMIDGGKLSTTSYITQTLPIPADKIEVAVQTALAGQLLGMKCIYLEAGSGASRPVSPELIAAVKKTINIPLIVGGGIRHDRDITEVVECGADMVILGTILEQDPDILPHLYNSFSQGKKLRRSFQ